MLGPLGFWKRTPSFRSAPRRQAWSWCWTSCKSCRKMRGWGKPDAACRPKGTLWCCEICWSGTATWFSLNRVYKFIGNRTIGFINHQTKQTYNYKIITIQIQQICFERNYSCKHQTGTQIPQRCPEIWLWMSNHKSIEIASCGAVERLITLRLSH